MFQDDVSAGVPGLLFLFSVYEGAVFSAQVHPHGNVLSRRLYRKSGLARSHWLTSRLRRAITKAIAKHESRRTG